jgi:phage I-like protein
MAHQRVTAALQSPLEASGSIVYLPEGTHTITASVNGKPKTVTVSVDESVLAAFNEDLGKRHESNVRPFAGFDHREGPASFLPQAFRYEPGVGLVLDVEWTSAGRAALDGRDYSYFSPTFLLSKDGVPSGLTKRGEIGSLVNDPAFEEIPRIAASHQPNNMEQLVELGLVEASCAPDQALEIAKAALADLRESSVQAAELETVKASNAELADKLQAAEAKMVELQTEVDGYKKQMLESAEASAQSAVEEAVKAGRIAPQDDDAKAFWTKSILADAGAAKVLASLPANPALDGQTILAGRKEDAPELRGFDRVLAAFKK